MGDSISINKIGRFSDGVQDTTGIKTIKNSDIRIKIYPNPTEGSFFLDINSPLADDEPCTVSLYDLSGRSIISSNVILLNGKFNGKLIIPDFINNGLYFVKIETATIHDIKKLIIQKL